MKNITPIGISARENDSWGGDGRELDCCRVTKEHSKKKEYDGDNAHEADHGAAGDLPSDGSSHETTTKHEEPVHPDNCSSHSGADADLGGCHV